MDHISSGQLLLDRLLDGRWANQRWIRLRIVTCDFGRFSPRGGQIVELRIPLTIERWIADAEQRFGIRSRAIFRGRRFTDEHVQTRRAKQREVTYQVSL